VGEMKGDMAHAEDRGHSLIADASIKQLADDQAANLSAVVLRSLDAPTDVVKA
jgi:hypothetical protein